MSPLRSATLLAAVARLEKAVGLRHVAHPPRVPVYVGLARIADQAERAVARALRGAWTDALDGLDVADAYQRGDVEAVVATVAERVHQRVQDASGRAFLRARQRAAEFVSGLDAPPTAAQPASGVAKKFPQMDFFHRLFRSLDWFLLNPRMVTAALTQATRLSQVERETTVQTIRQAVVDGLEQGLPYDEAASLIEGSVGLNDRQQRALARLSARLRDQGVDGAAYDKAVGQYADRARAYRAEMIARTEGQGASNGGAFDTYTEGRRQGILEADLVKEWIAAPDACPLCTPMNGQQQPLGALFQVPDGRGVEHPPAHPNCRCKFGMAEPVGGTPTRTAPAAPPVLAQPGPDTPSEVGYQYHATNAERAASIAQAGLTPHGPSYGTDQETWPDGGTGKRTYFNPKAGTVWQFAPEDGRPVILRVKGDAAPFKAEGTGDTYLTKPVPASLLEIQTDQGWKPLRDVFPDA